jgi:chromosome segregation ATPase
MAKAAVATPSVDFEAIDRLEQKLKMLVTVLDRTRAESARATDELARTRADYARASEENARIRAELDLAHARAAEAEGTGAELTVLRTEREQIRGRVDDMLRQIEALNL